MRKDSHIFCEVIVSYVFPFGVARIIVYTGTDTADLAAAGLLFHSHWLYIHGRSLTSFDLTQICMVRSEWSCTGRGCFFIFKQGLYSMRNLHKTQKTGLASENRSSLVSLSVKNIEAWVCFSRKNISSIFLAEFLLCGVCEPTLVRPFFPEPAIHTGQLPKDLLKYSAMALSRAKFSWGSKQAQCGTAAECHWRVWIHLSDLQICAHSPIKGIKHVVLCLGTIP